MNKSSVSATVSSNTLGVSGTKVQFSLLITAQLVRVLWQPAFP